MLGPILGPELRVLFVGINPSLRSAEVGHHFARPGNRFWPTLHAAGYTPRRLAPHEDHELPAHGVGVTNIASRPTRAASELSRAELIEGAAELEQTVRRHQPHLVAVVGLTAYRVAFARPKATIGLQPDELAGRPVWCFRTRAGSTPITSRPTSRGFTPRRGATRRRSGLREPRRFISGLSTSVHLGS